MHGLLQNMLNFANFIHYKTTSTVFKNMETAIQFQMVEKVLYITGMYF